MRAVQMQHSTLLSQAGCQVVVEIGGTPISAAHMEQMISPRKNWKRRRGDTILLAANAPNPTSQHIGQL